MSDKYQVIIAENEEVLFDCTEGDTKRKECKKAKAKVTSLDTERPPSH